MKRFILIPAILLLLFTSCKKDPDPIGQGLTDAMARDSLYYLMDYWYYWYNVMPAVNKDNYKNPYELMEALRYKPLDRWSFVADYNEFIAEMEGDFVGHGIMIRIDESGKARIGLIYSRSPLYALGVRRGWVVKSINNVDIAPIIISNNSAAYNAVLGESKEGVTNTFVFEMPDGQVFTISSTKTKFSVNTVLHYDTLHLSTGVTGHLVLESFILPTSDELATAFAFFKSNNVKDLILDMRYNTGGYLSIAQTLASYIAGSVATPVNVPFAKLIYNDINQNYNFLYPFKTTVYPLSLTRLVVITSRLTASASEAVMNGLSPFLEIIGIGDTTNGKPMGMNGWSVGEKYYYWPVTFKMVNNNDEGDYFDGLPPLKYVPDDVTRDFDDRNELCLKEAITYLETGSVSTKGFYPSVRQPWSSEKPGWINRGLTIVP